MLDHETIYQDFLAGVAYGDMQLTDLAAGDKVQLVHERSNKFDPNAIRVDFNGVKIGYIKRDHTHILHTAKALGRRPSGYISAVQKNNPSYRQVTIKILADKIVEPKDETL